MESQQLGTNDKNSYQVLMSMDYSLFKSIDGNRNKNLLHINRLKKSMANKYLFTIIIVNEKLEIIDGQHRFDAIVDLKLPIYYIICVGYGIKEVHILNQISKTWNADDYLNGYCNLGYKDYLIYKEFKEKHDIDHNTCMTLLTGSRNKGAIDIFYTGSFKVINYEKACQNIEKIFQTAPYYDGYKRRSFIYAMLNLFTNQKFNFDEFLRKLELQPTELKDCAQQDQYIEIIEEIYNYRRREKVNLRY